ncbi:MAG: MFS transporter [Planctomycetota bacterium]
MPAPIRRNYGRELAGTGFLSVGRAAFEGSVLAGVTRVAFDGVVDDVPLNYAVAAFATLPAASNVINFIWTRIAHGVNKTRFIAGVQLGMVLAIVAMSLMPPTPGGLVGLIGCALGAWICWSGYIAVRSTVWRANYARSLRARVAGKLSTVQTLTFGVLGLLLGAMLEDKPGELVPALSHEALGVEPWDIYRGFMLIAATGALVGTGFISTIRIRQHKRMLLAERESTADNTGPTLNPLGVIGLLLEDRRYGAYQVNQFLLGMGNLMMFPLIPIILRDQFNADYFKVLLLSSALSMFVVPLAVPMWARLLDGVHIVRFRAFHSWVFVIVMSLLLIAVTTHTMWMLYIVAALKGVAFAGGMLAWQLGHHDFAPASRAGEYMGVHVTLTGVRGLVGPAASVSLYNYLGTIDASLAPWAIGLCLALVVTGAIGFNRMNRTMDLTPVDDRPPADSRTRGPAPPGRVDG